MIPGFVVIEDNGTMAASELGPPKPQSCAEGWGAHVWRLSIEEGQPSLTSDCNLCHDGMNGLNGPEHDLWEMPAISVRIALQSEPGQPWYGVDPYWWLDITPVTDVEALS